MSTSVKSFANSDYQGDSGDIVHVDVVQVFWILTISFILEFQKNSLSEYLPCKKYSPFVSYQPSNSSIFLKSCPIYSHIHSERGWVFPIYSAMYLIGQNFGGQNLLADKIFGTDLKFRQFCPTKEFHLFLNRFYINLTCFEFWADKIFRRATFSADKTFGLDWLSNRRKFYRILFLSASQ